MFFYGISVLFWNDALLLSLIQESSEYNHYNSLHFFRIVKILWCSKFCSGFLLISRYLLDTVQNIFFQISMNEIVVACFSTKILVVSQELLIWVILNLRMYVHNFTTYNLIFALMSKAIDLKLTIKIAKLWNSPNQYCR